MKIGIHNSKRSYSEGWINYCESKKIPYKIVNAYSTNIIKDLEDCSIFMWHHYHSNPQDAIFAKQLLFSLEQAGKLVFPDWKTGWHFDDKLGQKYLLEALKLPIVPSYVYYFKTEADNWASNYEFPAVFKLRCGASSYNVQLIKTKKEAFHIIDKAFKSGFRQINPLVDLRENFNKSKTIKKKLKKIIKILPNIVYPYPIEKSKGREQGYVYFQEFIPNCSYDIRVQLIDDKCYAMTRKVRPNDFRASGGGNIDYDGSKVPVAVIELSFKIAKLLNIQSMAIDLLPYKDSFLISEISYAFAIDDGELDFGYWDNKLNYHSGTINPLGWMVDMMIKKQL